MSKYIRCSQIPCLQPLIIPWQSFWGRVVVFENNTQIPLLILESKGEFFSPPVETKYNLKDNVRRFKYSMQLYIAYE